MKNPNHIIIIILLLIIPCGVHAQDLSDQSPASVEKSMFGVQTGILGVWGFHEARLSNRIALRSDVGLDAGFWFSTYRGSGYVLAPVISVEPRWYYNIQKRERKSKNINNNSANFISLKTGYHPGWFAISNHKGRVIPGIYAIPQWGMKRNLSEKLHFELNVGIGYYYRFRKSLGYAENWQGPTANLRVAIGYTF